LEKSILDGFKENLDLLIESYRRENVPDILACILKLRSILGDIVPAVLSGESYESLRGTFTISAYNKMQYMDEREARLYRSLYETISSLERLTYILHGEKLSVHEKIQIVSFVKGLQDLYTLLKSEEFKQKLVLKPLRTVMSEEAGEDEIIELFIEKVPWKGEWFREVPVGLHVVRSEKAEDGKREKYLDSLKVSGNMKSLKRVDLVFMESNIPIYHREIFDITLFLTTPVFDNKKVFLIEAKTSAEKISQGIKQIFEYKELFIKDWKNVSVEKIVIICPEWTKKDIEECDRKGIEGWEVSVEGVSKVTS